MTELGRFFLFLNEINIETQIKVCIKSKIGLGLFRVTSPTQGDPVKKMNLLVITPAKT